MGFKESRQITDDMSRRHKGRSVREVINDAHEAGYMDATVDQKVEEITSDVPDTKEGAKGKKEQVMGDIKGMQEGVETAIAGTEGVLGVEGPDFDARISEAKAFLQNIERTVTANEELFKLPEAASYKRWIAEQHATLNKLQETHQTRLSEAGAEERKAA